MYIIHKAVENKEIASRLYDFLLWNTVCFPFLKSKIKRLMMI